MRFAPTLLAAVLAATLAAQTAPSQAATPTATPTTLSPKSIDAATQLRERALADDTGWKVVESLTTEVGPRMAGSEADARAVAWAEAKFKALGFDRVWTEPVTFPKWERNSESAAVVGAHSQRLAITALGGSPAGTVEAEVVRFPDLAALQAAPAGSLAGKIAFVDYTMARAKDGGGYGMGSRLRSAGPSAAIRAGAAAFLMRSAGTDSHRNPHTGITRFDDGLTPIPSAALATPDAAQLSRLVALGKPIKVRLALDCGWTGTATSANVIGEMRGRSKPDEVVVIGGHLDSWDLGTGAIDDGAGVAIAMGAGKLIGDMKVRPARTIRVVAFANEEQGLHGGRAYLAKHEAEVGKHQIAAESDFGAGASMPSAAAHRNTRRARSARSPTCWRPWASRTRRAKAARARTSARSRVSACRGRPCARTARITSTTTTRRTTRSTRSTRRRWRRTSRRMRCSPTWRRMRRGISGASRGR
jgi:hypothetical protein